MIYVIYRCGLYSIYYYMNLTNFLLNIWVWLIFNAFLCAGKSGKWQTKLVSWVSCCWRWRDVETIALPDLWWSMFVYRRVYMYIHIYIYINKTMIILVCPILWIGRYLIVIGSIILQLYTIIPSNCHSHSDVIISSGND